MLKSRNEIVIRKKIGHVEQLVMSNNKPIGRVAVGTGVISASRTALFLANGLEVVATDIAPNAEASLRRFVEAAWPALKRLGLAPGARELSAERTHSNNSRVDDSGFRQSMRL